MGIKYDITLPGVIDSFANDVRFQCSWRTAFTTGCAAFSEQCRDVVVILLFYLVLFAASAHAEGGFSSGGIGLFMTGTREMLL
ncbi:hypothetical protein K2S17_003045 [Salmonella enterica]|nr:hypothetical protein [Salmonella enterica]